MELLAGVALFLIFVLLLIITLIAVGVLTLLYKLLEKLVSYDVKTGLSEGQQLPGQDSYIPESADTTVPLDQFVPRPNVKITRADPGESEDQITPM